MFTKSFFLLLLITCSTAVLAAGNRVYFIEPKDGAEVTSPFKVKFGLEGMKIGPLGDMTKGHGHHHLIINTQAPTKDTVIPTDGTHLHFGKGQTETELTLAPGDYTLTLQFGDGAHRSYGPEMSSSIKVKVKEKAKMTDAKHPKK